MPEVSRREIGQRLYHVHREKRAQAAIKKIMAGLGDEWKTFSGSEIHLLGLLLQCTGNTVDQKIGDTLPFNRLTKEAVAKILSTGKDYVPGTAADKRVIDEIRKVLLALP